MDTKLVWFGDVVFKIGVPIGVWGVDLSDTVHQASIHETLPKHLSYPYGDRTVAVKLVKRTEKEKYARLKKEVDAVDIFKKGIPRNILTHHHSFKAMYKNTKNLVVVLPYDKELVSLRQTMYAASPTFRFGISEDCIAISLLGACEGLKEIHRSGTFHKKLTAGTIFYHRFQKNIKLAFGAAVYEPTNLFVQTPDGKDTYPVSRLSEWGRAPEVKNLTDDDYTSASDVWLVGIAALELAYGAIEVSSREELLFITEFISTNQCMPNFWDDLRDEYKNRNNVVNTIRKALGSFLTRCVTTGYSFFLANPIIEKKKFSPKLVEFVASCLNTDPYRRPSSLILPTHNFIQCNLSTMRFFENRLYFA